MTVQQILKWQSKQVISTSKHQPILEDFFIWPNQIAYVLDMRSGEIVESKGDYRNIFGYRFKEMPTVPHLYEPVVKIHNAEVVEFHYSALQWALSDADWNHLNSFVQYGYRIHHRSGKIKRVLKQGTILRESDGSVTHSLCTITDVSLQDSRSAVTVEPFGPKACLFDTYIPKIKSFRDHLSQREIEILKHVARGKTSNQIAQELHLSKHTIDTHRRNMINKLEVCNSIELVNLAIEMKLFK